MWNSLLRETSLSLLYFNCEKFCSVNRVNILEKPKECSFKPRTTDSYHFYSIDHFVFSKIRVQLLLRCSNSKVTPFALLYLKRLK